MPPRPSSRSMTYPGTQAAVWRGGSATGSVGASRGDEGGVIIPTAKERLQAGDVLALAGTHEAIAAATTALEGRNERGAGT